MQIKSWRGENQNDSNVCQKKGGSTEPPFSFILFFFALYDFFIFCDSFPISNKNGLWRTLPYIYDNYFYVNLCKYWTDSLCLLNFSVVWASRLGMYLCCCFSFWLINFAKFFCFIILSLSLNFSSYWTNFFYSSILRLWFIQSSVFFVVEIFNWGGEWRVFRQSLLEENFIWGLKKLQWVFRDAFCDVILNYLIYVGWKAFFLLSNYSSNYFCKVLKSGTGFALITTFGFY